MPALVFLCCEKRSLVLCVQRYRSGKVLAWHPSYLMNKLIIHRRIIETKAARCGDIIDFGALFWVFGVLDGLEVAGPEHGIVEGQQRRTAQWGRIELH